MAEPEKTPKTKRPNLSLNKETLRQLKSGELSDDELKHVAGGINTGPCAAAGNPKGENT